MPLRALPPPPPPARAPRVDTGREYLVGLLGSNVGHSRLPPAYAAAWRRLGVTGVCRRVDLGAQDEDEERGTADALRGMRLLGYDGMAVTMPCKELAVRGLDELEPAARVIGAINAIVARRDVGGGPARLAGYNADWTGAFRALREILPADCGRGKVCVLGAGGVSRAVVYAAARMGSREVALYDTDAPRARRVAGELSAALAAEPAAAACRVTAAPSLSDGLTGAEGVANCTPVGMTGGPPGSPVPSELLRSSGVRWVFDVVCYPAETPLLQMAAAAGLITIPGIRMNDFCLEEIFALIMGIDAAAIPRGAFDLPANL